MSSMFSLSPQTENLVLALYEISKLIAETGYPHTISEKLIFPVMKIMASRIYEKNKKTK